MDIEDLDRLASGFEGVRRHDGAAWPAWRLSGRLVARQVDAEHVLLRADFERRDVLVRTWPDTFDVPTRLAKHMSVRARLDGDADAMEEALEAAVTLQRGG